MMAEDDQSIVDAARKTTWPGGAIGALGAITIGVALGPEQVGDPLTSSEFVATLVVGALLALAGPLVITYAAIADQRGRVKLAIPQREINVADAEARAEQLRIRRIEAEIELSQHRRSNPDVAGGQE